MDIEFLTIRQFAAKMNYSERQIRQKCIDGRIPGACKVPSGRKWQIPVSALKGSITDGVGQQNQSQRNHRTDRDPVVDAARRQHYADLDALIARWKGEWLDPAEHPLFPTGFTKKDARVGSHRHGYLFWLVKPDGSIHVSFDIERDTLFECLRVHLWDELWHDFDELKEWLSEAIRQAASNDENRTDYRLELKIDKRVWQIAGQLDKALLKRVFAGRCLCCPG